MGPQMRYPEMQGFARIRFHKRALKKENILAAYIKLACVNKVSSYM